jgi:hypothetical protein
MHLHSDPAIVTTPCPPVYRLIGSSGTAPVDDGQLLPKGVSQGQDDVEDGLDPVLGADAFPVAGTGGDDPHGLFSLFLSKP